MESPLYEINDGKLKMAVSMRLYPQEVITAALYSFTGNCFVFQQARNDETVVVVFEPKDGIPIALDNLAKTFSNALIDQRLRFQLNQEFGAIREALVQRAFAPITKHSPS